MTSNPYEAPSVHRRLPPPKGPSEIGKVHVLEKVFVLAVGAVIGLILASWTAVEQSPKSFTLFQRLQVFLLVIGGPLEASVRGVAVFHPYIFIGWIGLALVPLHSIKPSYPTGLLSILGMILWFMSGFIAVVVMIWGA